MGGRCVMKICCEECGETIAFVSQEDFMILFRKNLQKYLCFHCSGFNNHPCKDCRFFIESSWFSNICSLRNDSSFDLICIDKEVEV